MKANVKNYTECASIYANKLKAKGYIVRFNWIDDGHQYDDITIIGRGEYPTPKKAYDALCKKSRIY